MQSLTLKQAHELTAEPINTLYRRAKRSKLPLKRDEHGELVVPLVAIIPPKVLDLAISAMKAMVPDATNS